MLQSAATINARDISGSVAASDSVLITSFYHTLLYFQRRIWSGDVISNLSTSNTFYETLFESIPSDIFWNYT